MKKVKLLVLLCLAFLLVMTAVACGNGSTTTANGTSGQTSESTTPADSSSTEPTASQFNSLKIGDTPISEYTIVYARSQDADLAAERPDLFPVYDYNRETATRLSDFIFEVSGVRLEISEDSMTSVTDYEILIGNTDRSDSLSTRPSSLRDSQYIIAVDGTKLVICGSLYGVTWHALDYFEEYLTENLEEENYDMSIASDYSYSDRYKLVRIGCIGDSITAGYGLTRWEYSYVSQLGRYLWKDAVVDGYGDSGKTLREDINGGGESYMAQGTFTNAKLKAAQTDIFTVMLGTNDSDRDKSWTSSDDELFNNAALKLWGTLYERNENIQFVLCNCPAFFNSGSFGSPRVRRLQEALVPILNDAGYPTTFFDMNSVTKPLGDYFSDGLHPDAEACVVMAEKLAEALTPIIDQVMTGRN